MRIFFATGNVHKLREVQDALPHVEKLSVDLDELQTTDQHAILTHKLEQAAAVAPEGCAILADDTGLYLDCLNGFPGPLIKWMIKAIQQEGVYELCKAKNNFGVTARVTLGLRLPSGEIHFFSGETKGTIVTPGKSNGFDWDAIFQPEGHTRRYCEIPISEKNTLSHRGKALDKLKAYLNASA